jgi:SRSO17 transposase
MLERALAAEVPASWVTGDTIYGQDRRLRRWLESVEQPFVLAVPPHERPLVDAGRGPQHRRVDELARRIPPGAWRRLSAGVGSKGERIYGWARAPLFRLWPGPWEHWLLVRQSLSEAAERAYYVVFAPIGTSLADLVRVAGSRWQLESCFESAKQEVGLDQYEVRSWSGWYRYITLALLAHAYLSAIRTAAARGEKGGSPADCSR